MWTSPVIFILSMILNLTVVPLLVIIWLPFVIWRHFIKQLAHLWAPQLIRILSPAQALARGQSGILAVTLNGRLDYDQVCDSFLEKVINRRHEVTGHLSFPKLSQIVSRFGGFWFWESELEFDIKSHVGMWVTANPTSVVTQEGFKTIVNSILKNDFDLKRSPWQLYVVNNTRVSTDPPGIGNKTTLILHFDHVLGDVKFMSENILQAWFVESTGDESDSDLRHSPVGHCHKKVNWRRIFKYGKFLVLGSYNFLDKFFTREEGVDWAGKVGGDKAGNSDLMIHMSEPISSIMIQDIRNVYEASAVAVILGAYAGALRRFMIQHLIKLPARINCLVQMEGEDGSQGEENLHITVTLPIDDLPPLSSKERIKILEKRLTLATQSTEPLTTRLIASALGSLPVTMVKFLKLFFSKFCTTTTTSFLTAATPVDKRILCNSEVVSIFPLDKFPVTNSKGPSVMCNLYGSAVNFILCADASLLPSTLPLKDLNTFIFKELNDLVRLDSILYV